MTEILKLCKHCVCDSTIPGISFDSEGTCSFCHQHDRMHKQFPLGEEGKLYLRRIAREIQLAQRKAPYDIIVGISGGVDSTAMLELATRILGLRALAVYFDNGWGTDFSMENMKKVTEALGVQLFVRSMDYQEYNSIVKAFLRQGVPDIEAPADLGLAAALHEVAARHKVRFIFSGHNFRQEGISPLGWLYADHKYIDHICRLAKVEQRSYPDFRFITQMKYRLINNIRFIRPLYYVSYDKAKISKRFQEQYDWQPYEGKHHENIMTKFWHTVFMPERFGADHRIIFLSALVRSGKMTRRYALQELQKDPHPGSEFVEEVRKKLGVSQQVFQDYMNLEKHSYKEFDNYLSLFRKLKFPFWIMLKLGYVTESFYRKFCTKELEK